MLESVTDKLDVMITRTWTNDYYCNICPSKHPIISKKSVSFALVIGDQHLLACIPGVDGGPCIPVVRYQSAALSSIGTHIFWVLAAAWGQTPRLTPVSADAHGPVTVLNRALLLGKEIHIFVSSGTGMRVDQGTGYSTEMQRIMNLSSSKCFGSGKHSQFKNVVFLQPALPYLDPPTNKMPPKQQLALIDIESANVARRLAINSSSPSLALKTFLSATENVGMDQDASTDCSLREMVKFQCMTNLRNHTNNLSHGVLKPCHLTSNQRFEWFSKERSNPDGSLTLSFISEYSAAVQIDYPARPEQNCEERSARPGPQHSVQGNQAQA